MAPSGFLILVMCNANHFMVYIKSQNYSGWERLMDGDFYVFLFLLAL